MKLVKNLKNKVLKKLKSGECEEIVSRNNLPLFISLQRTGVQIKNKELNFDNRLKSSFNLGPNLYMVKREIKLLEKRLKNKFNENNNFLEVYFNKVEADCQTYINKAGSINERSKACIDSRGLANLFEEYIEESIKMMAHLFPPLSIETIIIDRLKSEFVKMPAFKNDQLSMDDTLLPLLTSSEPSTLLVRKIAILKLAIKLKNKIINEESLEIKQEQKRFNWVFDHVFNLQKENFSKFLKEVKIAAKDNPEVQLNKIRAELREVKILKIKLFRKYNLSANIQFLIKMASQLPNLRFRRLEVFFQAGAILKNDLFPVISKQIGISINDLRYLYYWEISDLLRGKKINLAESLNRQNDFGLFVIGNQVQSLSAGEVKDLKRQIIFKNSLINKIEGSIACRGKAVGLVKIINNINDIYKFKTGNILVTAMTTPDYVPVMKKAAAFVTDEGGISCHAAIVAREMSKPCIIGTKIATKVLQDGDKVEVDANNGIARILKRA
jgi:phosphohistidine swiveling domain-containing protein